jgi:CRISPR-associated protein (TIGR02584 family)
LTKRQQSDRPVKSEPLRHVLVAVSGNTPQTVTETLYALMVRERPAVPISAVYIVTTSKGAEIAWKSLGGQQGAICEFCREYAIDPRKVVFEERNIIVLRAAAGGSTKRGRKPADEPGDPLEDIRTSDHNRAMASQLLDFIRQLTDDPKTVLHCSMGGGRRTMSAFMLTAMTLYGREQDRLSHVLVPEEFEEVLFPAQD